MCPPRKGLLILLQHLMGLLPAGDSPSVTPAMTSVTCRGCNTQLSSSLVLQLIEDLRKQLEHLQLFKLEAEQRRGRSSSMGLQEYNSRTRETELEQEIKQLKQVCRAGWGGKLLAACSAKGNGDSLTSRSGQWGLRGAFSQGPTSPGSHGSGRQERLAAASEGQHVESSSLCCVLWISPVYPMVPKVLQALPRLSQETMHCVSCWLG